MIPTRMHCPRLAPDGAPDWSPQFDTFIGSAVPSAVARGRRMWAAWWRYPYVVARLEVRFGVPLIAALIAVERDQESPAVIAETWGIPQRKLERVQRRATRALRVDYLPLSDRP